MKKKAWKKTFVGENRWVCEKRKTLTRFVPKRSQFCLIFIVIIFLEEIDELPRKPIRYGFGPFSFRIRCSFSADMRYFWNMAINTKKRQKKSELFLFFFFNFFITSPLMDRSSHLDLVAFRLLLKIWGLRIWKFKIAYPIWRTKIQKITWLG